MSLVIFSGDSTNLAPLQGMFRSILDESNHVIPQKHDVDIAEADIAMVGLQEVSKPLVHRL